FPSFRPGHEPPRRSARKRTRRAGKGNTATVLPPRGREMSLHGGASVDRRPGDTRKGFPSSRRSRELGQRLSSASQEKANLSRRETGPTAYRVDATHEKPVRPYQS